MTHPETIAPKSDSKRILLAEDDPGNCMVAVHMLENLGYEADVVASGLDVIRMIKTNHYAAVILDINMPGMDGLAAARAVRAYEQEFELPRIPIICITAHVLVGEKERCLAAGMDDYLAKPYRMEEFERKLSTLIEKPIRV